MHMKITRTKFKSRIGSFCLNRGIWLAALAFSLIASPVWATHLDSLSWEIHEPTTIGNAQIKPGNYLFRAEEGQSELQIMEDGKVVATVPCRWTQLTNKAAYSEVKTLNNQIIELHFAGRKEAIQFNP
jgi:hypothetical protein